MGRNAIKARRHKLASFLRYYGMTDEIDKYILEDRISDLKVGW
jgi:hypothetical protein